VKPLQVQTKEKVGKAKRLGVIIDTPVLEGKATTVIMKH
jgi:hypothetical protein